jgi:hypothetical protein
LRKWRKLWLLAAAAGLLGLAVGATLSAPVFVDTFDAQHPPTFWDLLIPNLITILPYALGPALVVLLLGWGINKRRSLNWAQTRNFETLKL